MHKLKSMPHLLPRSIKELFPDNIPKFGSSYEENAEWLSIYSGLNLRPSIFYKGPILAITEQNVLITCPSSIFSLSIYKKSAKRVLLNLQSDGISEEWPTFLLNNLPGLRKSARLNTQQSTRNYSENDNTNLSHWNATKVQQPYCLLPTKFSLPKTTQHSTLIVQPKIGR